MYSKLSLLPWGEEIFHTDLASANDGYPDWDGHNNMFSLQYPGALPKVNPILRVSVKTEGQLFRKKQHLGVAQISLRRLAIEPNKYNDDWYALYRDGIKTDAKIRVSFMFCPTVLSKDLRGSRFKTRPS